jgi:hypothetical protein
MKFKLQFHLLALMLIGYSSYSQIGIGTTNPAASAMLEIQSTNQGLLTPRMTTAQRIAIASPANGLLVYDTNLASFYYYETSAWVKINSGRDSRLNYKLLRPDNFTTALATELSNGGNSKYLLDPNTLYEVNGTLTLPFPIELNNAYIIGLDSGDDKLIRTTGDLFTGATGGSIRVLTLQAGGNVFNLTGTGAQSLILRDCIVQSSGNVGTISNFALVFVSIVNYVSNTNGIVYNTIGRLLLSNAAWFSNNSGKYETLTGTFSLVTKQGGFSEVTGTNIGFDVSGNPTITGDAVIESTVFSGALTTGKYINGYTSGSYSGFNFNNNWSIISPGVITEGDSQATGTTYSTAQVAINTYPSTSNTKLPISSSYASANLFRTTATQPNRITYAGRKGRIFQVSAAVSFDYIITNVLSNGNTEYTFFFVKVPASGAVEPQVASEIMIDTNAGFIQAFPIQGAVYLNSGDSVELWFRRSTNGNQSFRVRTFNMTMR